jgi:hypothetical protein
MDPGQCQNRGQGCCRAVRAPGHDSPTPPSADASSIAAAEEALADIGLPIETAVAALARAREADGISDRITCEGALADVQRVIGR